MHKYGIIIVAGGSGSRMQSCIPKQFMDICRRPVLYHTVSAFREILPGSPIVVVLPEEHMEVWMKMAVKFGISDNHTVCAGGKDRFGSVKNGLAHLPSCEYVMVHDGVRPIVSRKMIERVKDTVNEYGTAIPATEPYDSFRIYSDGHSRIIDRTKLRAVQTPQAFRYEIIRDAYDRAGEGGNFTDDASVVEASGLAVTLCEGDRANIKITVPEDVLTAEAIMRFRPADR